MQTIYSRPRIYTCLCSGILCFKMGSVILLQDMFWLSVPKKITVQEFPESSVINRASVDVFQRHSKSWWFKLALFFFIELFPQTIANFSRSTFLLAPSSFWTFSRLSLSVVLLFRSFSFVFVLHFFLYLLLKVRLQLKRFFSNVARI